ncbi:MAG: zinc ABC transporter substrate-binding protein [Candidatus Hydrogenedentes bacterium]|nr:zinc ABC transporter substrate-binding protein [Candidatus Hydrogenedentota bacterium]
MRHFLTLYIYLLLFLAVLGLGGRVFCENSPAIPNYKVAVGSSSIYSAVKEFVDAKHITDIIIPPDLCPGHFDLKPGDVEKFLESDLIILHNWQKDLPAIKSLLRVANPNSEKLAWVPIQGSWMLPQNYVKGLEAISKLLMEKKIISKETGEEILERRKREILRFSEDIKNKISALKPENIYVISSSFQSEFLRWLGFNVVGEYSRAEEITLKTWGDLLKTGKEKDVKLIVENLQSGELQTVKALANDLNAKSVVLSNFPMAETEDKSWEDSVLRNVNIIINALR